jgi:hypothetical protein
MIGVEADIRPKAAGKERNSGGGAVGDFGGAVRTAETARCGNRRPFQAHGQKVYLLR